MKQNLRINVSTFLAASYIKICNRNDPNINVCITNSIEQLRHKLTTGIPELKVPGIEPLAIKRVHLLRDPQNAKLDFLLSNLQVGIVYQSCFILCLFPRRVQYQIARKRLYKIFFN